MIRFIYRNVYLFTKITPAIYPNLKAKFQKELSLKTLGPYYTSQNNQDLFNIIMQSKIAPNHANNALDHLAQLCKADSDEEINLLVNIVKQKALNYTKIRDTISAIAQFQQAVSLVLLMTNPNPFSLSQMYKFTGDLCVQINDLKKGEKNLKDAQNVLMNLKELDEEDIKFISSGLACIQTQLCMISYRQKKPAQAVQRLKKALSYWEKVQNKILQEYELTCRLKCMLHVYYKEENEALQAAKHYLSYLNESKEYKASKIKKNFLFSKLYYLNIICTYSQKCQAQENQMVQFLKQYQAQKGQQKLIELMMMVGIQPQRYNI